VEVIELASRFAVVTRRTIWALVVAVVLGASVTSEAIVPPKNCGTITVQGHRYTVKADQLTCRSARAYAERYLGSNVRPRGYSCRRYKGSALVARCVNTRANPDRTIFMIKR
jgi:hypothetical protein